ncbi:hypothetical protein [Singulisphaera sp. GP187]|uniref:hypothetical protein n=1 Tax=Singulisphaera sp. GP187 TaxID=1882752 RepID=UPI0009408721|nr:hypothetical protein [Singulisphaera sp. GP187]
MITALLMGLGSQVQAAELDLPPRPSAALGGVEFARSLADLPLEAREAKILVEFERGNVPRFLRTLVPVSVTTEQAKATYYVTPDYLAIGSDDDYVLVPMTPFTAQKLADRLDCVLPTPKMVDDIYAAAAIKLSPSPIPPTPAMTTVPVFIQHNETVRGQRKGMPLGALIAGHKKDVVIASRLFATPGKVAIYGWHKREDGRPIQPLFTGHVASWVDYSHGIRLIQRRLTVNGEVATVDDVLADPALAPLLSHDGKMTRSRYEFTAFPAEPGVKPQPQPQSFEAAPGETNEEFRLEPGVRIVINRPDAGSEKPVLLVYYALPNGATIEQTIGKATKPGDDWHFDIQHIGAQTRFLREKLKDRTLVVAYLENDLKSWPAWRKTYGDKTIAKILDTVQGRFDPTRTRVVFNGHSGGGSLIFGYLNGLETIPDAVERIAFLDSDYGYETDRHRDKLAVWLRASDSHVLCVLAYNDAVALLNGKTFVSAAGGTWGRSQLMQADLERSFPFQKRLTDGMHRITALDGRVTFFLKENPEKKIFHTVQVERNGFIESLLSGTRLDEVGYSYFGDRAYSPFIRAD